MSDNRKAILTVAATFALFVAALLIGFACMPKSGPSAAVLPEPHPSGTAKLVAVTPDGTRIYRVEGPELIVPALLAVSPTGQVTFQ